MSKYTTQVRYILENEYKKLYPNDIELNPLDVVERVGYTVMSISKARDFTLDVNFVIVDEVLRQISHACDMVLLKNYTREIGLETVGLWKLKMQTRLNEIFPFYAKIYITMFEKYDPFIDTDITHTTKSENGTTETEQGDIGDKDVTETVNNNYSNISTTTSNNKDKYSDTPQGSLQNVESGEYLTNARIVDNSVNGNDEGTSLYNRNLKDKTKIDVTKQKDATMETTTSIKGKSSGVSYSKMMIEYRKSIININTQFVDEFKDLFMLIY